MFDIFVSDSFRFLHASASVDMAFVFSVTWGVLVDSSIDVFCWVLLPVFSFHHRNVLNNNESPSYLLSKWLSFCTLTTLFAISLKCTGFYSTLKKHNKSLARRLARALFAFVLLFTGVHEKSCNIRVPKCTQNHFLWYNNL